jgi:hypothetical protein
MMLLWLDDSVGFKGQRPDLWKLDLAPQKSRDSGVFNSPPTGRIARVLRGGVGAVGN